MTHDYNDSRMVYTRRSHDPQMTLVSPVPTGHMTHDYNDTRIPAGPSRATKSMTDLGSGRPANSKPVSVLESLNSR